MRASEKYKSPYGKAPRKVEDVVYDPKMAWDDNVVKEAIYALSTEERMELRVIAADLYQRVQKRHMSEAKANYSFLAELARIERRGRKNPYYSPPEMYGQISIDEIKNIEPQIKRPSYTKTILPPPPEFYCIQYIGGVFNAEQQFLRVAEYPQIAQGANFERFVLEEPNPNKLQIKATSVETQNYKLTFIPQSETAFSDAQVVIALFQP